MRMITVLGPSQSGKSTLVEALSKLEGRPETAKVSDEASLTTFCYLGDDWCAADIAGGPEHLNAAARALAGSDAAVLVVSPDPAEAVLAAPYIRLVEASGTPCFLFVNRMDAAQARARDVIAALQEYANHSIVLRQVPIREGGEIVGVVDLISERAWKYKEGQPSDLIEVPDSVRPREEEARTELLEHLADFDDALLEQLIEDKRPASDEVFHLAASVLEMNADMPAFLGAASHANGVTRLMKALRHETPDVTALAGRLPEGAIAVGVAADVRKHMGKFVILRALGDGLKPGRIGGETVGALTGIDGKSPVAEAGPGEVAMAVKADHLNAGTALTADGAEPAADWLKARPPTYRRLISPANERDEARLSGALARLAEIDPGLEVSQDARTGKPVLAMQGPMHARRIAAKLAEDFGIEIEDAPLSAEYRETIGKRVERSYRHKKQSGGAGQFADVAMIVEPLPRGGGFEFAEVVKGGAVPKNYIPAVEHGAEEALAEGPLGFPVIDVKATLTDGKHHAVDSSDFAFRTAGLQCVKEALREGGQVLLQPVLKVDIHVPSAFSGGLVPMVSSLKGQVLGFEANPDAKGWDVFSCMLPGAAEEELFRDLAGATQGTAWFEAEFDHYEEVYGREAERIAAEAAEAS